MVFDASGPGGTIREQLANIRVGSRPDTPDNSTEALDCMASYSGYGLCTYDHWSDMYETCRLYDFPPLDDEATVDSIRAGRCSYDNWSNLYGWLISRIP